jgi:hypothetical protein
MQVGGWLGCTLGIVLPCVILAKHYALTSGGGTVDTVVDGVRRVHLALAPPPPPPSPSQGRMISSYFPHRPLSLQRGCDTLDHG